MKKIILVLLSVLLLAGFAVGCGVEDPLNPSATVPDETDVGNIVDTDYPDTVDGLYRYMLALGLINDVNPTEMSADLIGAKEGNKYSYKLNGKQVNVELYSYDLNDLSDTAEEIISSVKSSGKFEILGLGEVDAMLSDSGKYLLIYSDKAFDSKNPNEANVQRRDSFIEAFKGFHK